MMPKLVEESTWKSIFVASICGDHINNMKQDIKRINRITGIVPVNSQNVWMLS